MGLSSQTVGLLLRLGFDPSDAKKGLAQARQHVARYRAEVVIEEQKLRTARARLQQEATADATAGSAWFLFLVPGPGRFLRKVF